MTRTFATNICVTMIILWLTAPSFPCHGETITVPQDYATIQAAIDAAIEGDEIIVSPGTYYENVNFAGKNIVLRSSDPTNPTVASGTIIDGNLSGSVVTFSGTELTTCILSGFTIANGYAPEGGGIWGGGTLATIQYNNITSNTTYGHFYEPSGIYLGSEGGGIYQCNGIIQHNLVSGNTSDGYDPYGGGLYDCNGIIRNNSILENSAQNGAGLSRCNGIIQNNIISGNSAGYGGGLSLCNGIIENNVIADNLDQAGGGGLGSCNATIQNNTIVGNSSIWSRSEGGGLRYCRGSIVNCIIWGNSAAEAGQLSECSIPLYSCIQGWTGAGRGNIATDPKFVDQPNGDYHLQADSPCIDAGNTFYLFGEYIADIDGECRLIGNSVDMGSDEYGSSLDSDSDFLPDNYESLHGTNPHDPDTDGDGLRDGIEVRRGTNPAIYDTPSGLSIPSQYVSIQQAIFMAFPSEILTVAPGTYYENLHVLGKNVILQGTDPLNEDIVSSTVINGGEIGSVVTFSGAESEQCTLRGLSITNGTGYNGGGICGNGTLATVVYDKVFGNSGQGLYECHGTIANNMIYDNTGGSGAGLSRCNGIIEDNTITSNSATGQWSSYGGGLYQCDGIIQRNIISGNAASGTDIGTDGYGGGLSLCEGIIRYNTISNNTASWFGGGLFSCRGTIQYNIISNNMAARSGAGLYGCSGVVRNNIISGNSVVGYDTYGGGLSGCRAFIHNNTIVANSAQYGGGLSGCDGTIQNNTVFGNSAQNGGGFSSCYGTIQNNTISGNAAEDYGGGLYRCHGFIVNCIMWGDAASTGTELYECNTPFYSCIQGWAGGGKGNISAEPEFVDPSSGNYHLKAGSPCIDVGNSQYLFGEYIADIDGECRVSGSSVDMGSDEYASSLDTDGDLLADSDEALIGTETNRADTDGDGLQDGIEAVRGTNPRLSNVPPGISIPSHYSSIQQAIFLAFPSEMITLSPGTYTENIHVLGRNIVLQSTDPFDPDTVNSTIIDGGVLSSVIFLTGTEDETCLIRGLTIRNGSSPCGGGICGNRTQATLEHNKITDNSAERGGGIYQCDGIIENNIITDNIATGRTSSGGGLYSCDGITQYNTISDNSASHGGGLAWCDGTIQNNTISRNSASYGGGLAHCSGISRNNILNNSATSYGGGLSWCSATIQYNIISGNSAPHGAALAYCNSTIQSNDISHSSGDDALYYCDGTIQGNAISDNAATGLFRCDGLIQSNIISRNRSTYGGGLSWCGAIVRNNIISHNSSAYGGGFYGCGGTIQNNIITWNNAPYGGGGLYNCYGYIQNNTIWGNSVDLFGGGLYECGGTISNCIIWDNTGRSDPQIYDSDIPSYSCIQDWSEGGTGNISDDPQLVDPANGNFHLLPTSPCIDAGGSVEDLAEDFEGDPRPYDGTPEVRGDGSDFDIGADEYVGAVPLKDYNFELANEGWTSVTLPAFFTPPNFYYVSGHLILTSQNNTNTYGFWASEADAIPVIPDCLYRARWTVATDVTNPLLAPQMQLRINSQNLQQADLLVVGSAGDGSYAPIPDGRTYNMYFIPPDSCLGKPEDQDDLILSFDILNFDPADAADGSLMLDSVAVEAIPLNSLSAPTLLETWGFDADAEGWNFGSAPLFFTEPLSDTSDGALWLIAQNNTNTFGFWGSPVGDIHVEQETLYRIRFIVSTNVTSREEVPQLRLRASSQDFQASIVKVITSVTGAEVSPTPEGRTYDLYFYPPQSLVETEVDSILAAFDILNFDPLDAPNGALLLDTVTVESLSVP